MPSELHHLFLNLPLFALVIARLGGLLFFQPILAALSVPVQVRAVLVLALAAMMAPLAPVLGPLPSTPVELALGLARELVIGAALGAVSAAAFIGLQTGGMLLAQETGLSYGQVLDPASGEESSVLSMFYMQLGVATFLLVGGHRTVVRACLETFQTIPLGNDGGRSIFAADLAIDALRAGSTLALQVAMPTLVTLFLLNTAMGFAARTLPQLNLLSIGFSIKTLIGFALMAASLPAAVQAFLIAVEHGERSVAALIHQ